MNTENNRVIARRVAAPATAAFVGLVLAALSAPAAESFALQALSARPDMVTGGSVLVEISGATMDALRVTASGRDVTAAFRPSPLRGTLIGRIEGLDLGKNVLEARWKGARSRLEIVNHPITGPVFSGPHQAPFTCDTAASGLGDPLDEDCSAKTKVTYYYKSTEAEPPPAEATPAPTRIPGFKELDLKAPRPADIARIVMGQGRTVNWIVRVEMGTINRAIYMIAFLHEPGEPLPDPWTRTPGWNGRLVYQFGGGCKAGYHQARLPVGLDDNLLSKGYAVAKSSLNIFGNNCDDVISAETLMMVKEYFTKSYGVPVHTIGSGGSGGSMQQYLIAQNYPGLLDGITPSHSYPDVATLVAPVSDCALLARTFESGTQPWTDAQKTAVSGYATWDTCRNWMKLHYSPGWVVTDWCDVPKDQLFHPTQNPRGVRCSLEDNQVNIYGRDEKTGFAPSFYDNTGVQYGLAAFNSGAIGADRFVELNERIGGFDPNGDIVAQRSVAATRALRTAYRTGRVNVAGGSLGSIPIIDYRPYVDLKGDFHDRLRSFEIRTRLRRAQGRDDNLIVLTNPVNANSVPLMDEWLDRIERDHSGGAAAEKIVRNKPEDLVNACWTEQGEKVADLALYGGTGRCNELYPPHGDPRIAAGAPLANDVLKCALKPLRAEDYRQPLAEEQLGRLKALFPNGVCDYSRPGVEQAGEPPQPWRKY